MAGNQAAGADDENWQHLIIESYNTITLQNMQEEPEKYISASFISQIVDTCYLCKSHTRKLYTSTCGCNICFGCMSFLILDNLKLPKSTITYNKKTNEYYFNYKCFYHCCSCRIDINGILIEMIKIINEKAKINPNLISSNVICVFKYILYLFGFITQIEEDDEIIAENIYIKYKFSKQINTNLREINNQGKNEAFTNLWNSIPEKLPVLDLNDRDFNL